MDRGVWRATVHEVHKESGMTEQPALRGRSFNQMPSQKWFLKRYSILSITHNIILVCKEIKYKNIRIFFI